MTDTTDYSDRHPGVQELMGFFVYDHLRGGLVRDTSKACGELADAMLGELDDCAELTFGLRQLLLAKDALVRCAVKQTAAA